MAKSQREWEHCYDLSGACPICGRAAHIGASLRTGKMFWLHDNLDGSNSIA